MKQPDPAAFATAQARSAPARLAIGPARSLTIAPAGIVKDLRPASPAVPVTLYH